MQQNQICAALENQTKYIHFVANHFGGFSVDFMNMTFLFIFLLI